MIPLSDKKYIQIGLATVSTRAESYLLNTLESLLAGIPPAWCDQVTITILDANESGEVNNDIVALERTFPDWFARGTLRILSRGNTPLAPFEHGDNVQLSEADKTYCAWRSKQCQDYALLFDTCFGKAKYYLHVEDDIIATRGYVNEIVAFIEKHQQSPWSCARFCDVGFIGILLPDHALPRLSALCRLYHNELPVDWILDGYCHFAELGGTPKFSYHKSLFQHVGTFSSLRGKIQNVKAETFQLDASQRVSRTIKSVIQRYFV